MLPSAQATDVYGVCSMAAIAKALEVITGADVFGGRTFPGFRCPDTIVFEPREERFIVVEHGDIGWVFSVLVALSAEETCGGPRTKGRG